MKIKFFWMPAEVWYYVIIPIIVILLIYFIFTAVYNKKKDTYYYHYIVDYVYSTLGILFCTLLLCLLLGYSIATLKILYLNSLFSDNLILTIVLFILPIIPFAFLIYVSGIYIKNLKRKDELDSALEENIELVKKAKS